SLVEGPDALIVAPPGKAKLQAFVLISNAETEPHRRKPVRNVEGVFVLAGEVEDGGAEDRQIAFEQHAASQSQLFLVAKVFDGGVNVAIEPQIANLEVGLLTTD